MTVRNSVDERTPQVDMGLTDENAALLGRAFWLMADEYTLKSRDAMAVLGLNNRATLANHRTKKSIPRTYDAFRRVSLMLGIKKNLELIYPQNAEVRSHWLHVKRHCFKEMSALEFISDDLLTSQSRIFTVRRLLDMLRNGTVNEVV